MKPVYTIGYEGTDLDRLIATLRAVGVKRLADVRAVAQSRKKGFSKRGLAARLEAEGIEYFHLVDLGDPKAGREAARAGFIERFRAIYSEHLETQPAQFSLRELETLAEHLPTCLLCFERDPKVCHRSIIAENMVTSGFNVFDLYGDDPQRYVRHGAKLPGGHPCEGAAAA